MGNKLKLILNAFSIVVLILIFIFIGLFVSIEAGFIDMDPDPQVHGPDNTTGVPEVTASNHSQINGEELEIALYQEVNNRREAAGERKLVHSERVRLIARIHSKDMADREYFDHKNPEGQGSRERHSEYDACDSTNENLAKIPLVKVSEIEVIAEEIVDGWTDSKGHYSIMMSDYPHVTGVGVHVTSDGVIYATQNFCWEHPSA